MNSHNQANQPPGSHQSDADALVLPLTTLDRTQLSLVGGKAANLGELTRAGFSVPDGFCVTTIAYAMVSASLEPVLAELARLGNDDVARQAELAAAARAALLQASVPTSITEAITRAYQALGNEEPIAVRSSATAEDLPSASFAGQQETYLNIIGINAVLTAVQHCWSSLWTERSVSYRRSLSIDPGVVRIAVVVQRMVEAQCAGVLFTANPLTGKRHQVVIDANPGLGEAVVSGATNPDHFVVNMTAGEIVERRLGDKQTIIQATPGGGTQKIATNPRTAEPCLSDAQVRALAELGAKVEAHFAAPQDIEWAMDASGQFFLLQARPITTLFPLPAAAPPSGEFLRVYLSYNVQQGTYRPFTPMGISATRLLVSSLATLAGFPPREPLTGPGFVTEAASRIFFDVTAALRSSFGRTFLVRAMSEAEVHAAVIFRQLASDPRLSLLPIPRLSLFRTIILLLVRTGMPWHLLHALLLPQSAHARLRRQVRMLRSAGKVAANASASDRLAAVERLILDSPPHLLSGASPVMLGGMQAFALASKFLGDLATASELQVVLRGAPSNPTTEMNLALWSLAKQVQIDPAITHLLQQTPPVRLAEDYRNGSLPPLLQHGLATFLAIYGHRSVAELDLGVPRWSEDPAYVLGILASYQEIRDPVLSPDMQFRRAAEEAEVMMSELTRRARRKSWLRGLLVSFFLGRARALAGLREMPRFCFTLLLARARALLWPVGEELVRLGPLEVAGDIFFITLLEAHEALAGTDMRALASARRADFERELARRHVPLVLLSDGTEPTIQPDITGLAHNTLQGTPASPGIVTAPARVILDPHGASIAPGEILVAPSTDPGWTPLFLTAGGLVMEMGGAMAHGAIVAREYGIPAVVAVPQSTERITTGMILTVDGAAGTIFIEPGSDE
jgi:pyruvate,water dikinase